MVTITTKQATALSYIRVSTPSQQVDEQVKTNNEFAAEKGVRIIGQYGDYGKRHKAHKRQDFQAMMKDVASLKPDYVYVQRLDRFGTAGPNQLGSFLTTLKEQKVKLITTLDGMDRSKEDVPTVIQNMISACQSTQEQIDKAERVLTGKRAKALLGEYIGSKYLVYGFDVVCVGSDQREKWRLVEDGSDCRIRYVLNERGEYVEAERYGNEIIKDANGIMPDKEIRHRPTKDTSDRLFYSPSIRQERVATLRRICEWFDAGWTTYRIAGQLNDEGIKPVYADKWYSSFIDGLLENSLVVGKPAWNKTSQSNFRHVEGGKIVSTDDELKAVYREHRRQDWFQPFDEVFEPIIEPALFDRIQSKLEARRNSTPKRSPRSEQLWLGGLWWDADTDTKLAGNSQGKHFRVKHPDHAHKRLTFKEAERFIGDYLKQVGHRIETLGEAAEDKKLLEKLATEEWLKELHLDQIVLQIGSYLEAKLGYGFHHVGDSDVIVDYDDEHNLSITTDADYLELYCRMVSDDMEKNQQAVQTMMDERKRLTLQLMAMPDVDQFVVSTYNDKIAELSREIAAATSSPDYMEWWNEVLAELQQLRENQAHVKQAIELGSYVQKAEAIRRLIDRIDCHWADVPTTDGRYKSGFKTICHSVTVHSTAAAMGKDGQPIPIMTIETSPG